MTSFIKKIHLVKKRLFIWLNMLLEIFSMHVITTQKYIIPSFLLYNWEPPPMSVCKVNCDANVFENEQLTDFCCIIKDNGGNWIKRCSVSIPFSSVFYFELHAI
ncbi:hypothetical protein AHAS_Ahas19G0116000 [Arachis hypogaea]